VTDKITTTTTKYDPNPKYQIKNPESGKLIREGTGVMGQSRIVLAPAPGTFYIGGSNGISQFSPRYTEADLQASMNAPKYLYGDQPEYLEKTTNKVTYNTRQVTGKGPLTDAELKAIQGQAEERTRKIKRKTAELEKGSRQKRGATGLMGRSEIKKVGLAADLPDLGFDGLGIQKTYLG